MVDDRVKRIVELIEPLRVKPGSKVRKKGGQSEVAGHL